MHAIEFRFVRASEKNHPPALIFDISFTWRYITDTITRNTALEMPMKQATTKASRKEEVERIGYPSYVNRGCANVESDHRRGKITHPVIDDPLTYLREGHPRARVASNGRMQRERGMCLYVIDWNEVWDAPHAIEYMTVLAEIKPWFTEEPYECVLSSCLPLAFVHSIFSTPVHHANNTLSTAPFSHASICHELKPVGISVATGEHAHNLMVFKRALQAGAVSVVQIDSSRLAGVSEVLAVFLLTTKFGKPVCPHAGGVGLREYVIHLR